MAGLESARMMQNIPKPNKELQEVIQQSSNKQLSDYCAIVKNGNMEIAIEALSDQVIIEEDKFKTGYECSKCNGESYLNEDCDFCKGKGRENFNEDAPEALCRKCCPLHMIQSGGMRPGKLLCPQCNGRGGILVAPEISQRRPTSGIVKSVGPEVKVLKVGDRALYSMFAGTAINFKQKNVIRIMHEHEVMSRLHGVGKIGEWMR